MLLIGPETNWSLSSTTAELAATSQIRDKVATLEAVSKLVEPGLISTEKLRYLWMCRNLEFAPKPKQREVRCGSQTEVPLLDCDVRFSAAEKKMIAFMPFFELSFDHAPDLIGDLFRVHLIPSFLGSCLHTTRARGVSCAGAFIRTCCRFATTCPLPAIIGAVNSNTWQSTKGEK
jgi:hypothetical protein